MSRPLLDTQYELDGDPGDHRDALEGPSGRRRWGSRFLAFLVAAAAVYGAARGFAQYSTTAEELNSISAMTGVQGLKKMPTKDDLGGTEPEKVIASWTQQNAQRVAADRVHLWSAYGLMLLCPLGLAFGASVWWRGQFKRPQGAAVLDPAQLSMALTSVVLLAAVRGFDAYTVMSLARMAPAMDLRTAFHEAREARKPERFTILKEKFNTYAAKVKDRSAKPAVRIDAARRLEAVVSRQEFAELCPGPEKQAFVETMKELIKANYADESICTVMIRSVGAAGAVPEMAEISAERERTKAAWVDVKSEAGYRTLDAAVRGNDEASVAKLIQRGISVNVLLPGEGRTALHEAVAQKNLKIAKLLLDGRARPDVAGKFGQQRPIKEYPIHRAVAVGDAQLVKLLLDRGANPNVSDDGGMTPLHRAAAAGEVDCAQALLQKNAKVNSLDKAGRTPFDVAQQVCAADKRPPIRDLLEKFGGMTAVKTLPRATNSSPAVAATPKD